MLKLRSYRTYSTYFCVGDQRNSRDFLEAHKIAHYLVLQMEDAGFILFV